MRGQRTPPLTLTDIKRRSVTIPTVSVTVTPPRGSPIEAPLGLQPLTLGTSPECDVVVNDPHVSRKHCQLTLTEDGIVLRDLGSKNGTLLGHARIFSALLEAGVTATFGGSKIRVRSSGDPSILPLSASASFGEAIGWSMPMRALFAKLERAATTAETVLLLGENGTGKELLARGIHDASPRRNKPFVVFDCSAVTASLIEGDLFGHEKGAFTGAQTARAGLLEQADGGTLFIDEIGELPLDLQPKLLRALESKQARRLGASSHRSFDARVVAATNKNLRARVASGSFREDLYYRLAVVEVRVPPLRERKDDIPLLVERFLGAHSPARTLDSLPPNAMDIFQAHDWPGNVRELRNIVARLLIFGADALSPTSSDGPDAARTPSDTAGQLAALPWSEARELALERFARAYLPAKLKANKGNVTKTAEAMGISRQSLHDLLKRHGLRDEDS